jgi:hypothetical protein
MSFAFQAGHGLARAEGSTIARFLEFVGFQAALYSVGIFFLLIYSALTAVRRCRAGSPFRDQYLFLLWLSAPTLLFFTLNSFRATVEGNWPILGFIPLFVIAGAMADEWLQNRSQKTILSASVAVAALLIAFVHVQVVDPVIPHPKRFEISRRIYGWKILGEVVGEASKGFPVKFLIADRFQTAGLLEYYTRPHIPGFLIGPANLQRYTFRPDVDVYKGGNAIYVVEEGRDKASSLTKIFERVDKFRNVEINRKGELIRRFNVYRCYNYRGGLNESD